MVDGRPCTGCVGILQDHAHVGCPSSTVAKVANFSLGLLVPNYSLPFLHVVPN